MRFGVISENSTLVLQLSGNYGRHCLLNPKASEHDANAGPPLRLLARIGTLTLVPMMIVHLSYKISSSEAIILKGPS